MWSEVRKGRPSADPDLEGQLRGSRQPATTLQRQLHRLKLRSRHLLAAFLLPAWIAALGGNCLSDNSIASENGDIYFFSPEQLDGTRGIPNQENLYDYRNGQRPVRRPPLTPATSASRQEPG